MSKLWRLSPLISALAMCAVLSACSGASREESEDDIEEYCASVHDADAICAKSEPNSDSLEPAAPAGQTGFNKVGPNASDVPPGDLVFF